jgi:hypothetical protein
MIIDAISATELIASLNLIERWRYDPAWSSIRSAIVNPEDFSHTVILLAAASLFADAGNAPQLYTEKVEGKRAEDLRLVINSIQHVAVEVKCPRKLQHPSTPLLSSDAKAIVRAALKKAGTGPGGQLAHSDGSMLIIGGFHLRDADLAALEAASKRELEDLHTKRESVAAIALVSVGTVVFGGVEADGEILSASGTQLSPYVTVRITENSSYKGSVRLKTERRNDELSRVEVPLKEVIVRGIEELDPER